MSLVSKQDFLKISGLSKLGILGNIMASWVMRITKLYHLNVFYDSIKHHHGKSFFEAFLSKLNVQYEVYEEDLAKIPKTGPFILVANHPLGAVDGILMCKILSDIRPDFKIMGNFLLQRIAPMKEFVIPVNPFETRKDAYSSMQGMRNTLKHLQEGGCVGIFPAGAVSNKNNTPHEIQDMPWEIPAIKLIKKAKVPVVPLYFHAKNSRTFYSLAKLSSDLQTLMLPSEMLKKKVKPIKIRIGRAVSPKVLEEYESVQELGDFLRKKVYMMKSYYERRKSIAALFKLSNLSLKFSHRTQEVVQNIIEETPVEELVKDIENLNEKDKLLFKNANYEVYFTDYEEIPSVMREIGRQRELTFRAIGEGTNLPFDLDEYDKHYHHLILWDSDAQKIAGAYRMALGSHVMKNYGIEGFYTSSLFEYDPELRPFFRKVIEMGRAYVSLEYQQKPLPLFLLWRGIIHVCLRNPEHKFLMGGVSISNRFSDFSKSLMIEFMRSHYYDSVVAQYVHPKNDFKVRLKEKEKNLFFEGVENDLNKFDKLIDDLEPGMRLPVLIKKYIKQNARVIAFNVDPNFNDAIDGLMYIRISDLPESTIKPVLEELSDQLREA